MQAMKKGLAAGLACLLLLTSACGKEPQNEVDISKFSPGGDPSQTSSVPLAPGSYTESELLTLDATPLWLDIQKDGTIGYAAIKKNDGEATPLWYVSDDGLTFSQKDAFWIAPLQEEAGVCRALAFQQDGSVYATIVVTEEGKSTNSFFHIGTDGKKERITLPEDWDESTVVITSTGKWFTGNKTDQDTVAWYDAPGGKKLGELSAIDRYFYSNGDSLVSISIAGEARELALYDLNTGDIVQRRELSPDSVGKQVTAVGFGENSVYVAGNKGLCRLGIPDGVWEKRIATGAFSFFATSKTSGFLREDQAGNLYLVTGGKLLKLTYDPNGTPKEGTPFRITTMLMESAGLRAMAEEFQLKHPELDVQLEENLAGYSPGEEWKSYAAKRKKAVEKLKETLTAGGGPDILILDELPVSLLEEEAFLDLSDKIPLDGMLPNVMSAYEKDGKRFALPASFTVPLTISTSSELAGASLEEMVSKSGRYAKSQFYQDPRQAGQRNLVYFENPKEIAALFYPLYQQSFGTDGKYQSEAIEDFLSQGGTIAKKCAGAGKNYSSFYDQHVYDGVLNGGTMATLLTDDVKVLFANSIANFYEPVDKQTFLSPTHGATENVFMPAMGMAIPTESASQETSLAFINFALSREGQSLDAFRYQHLPVREDLLTDEAILYEDGQKHTAVSFQDGTELQSSNQVSPTPLELIRSLKSPIFIDRELMDAICWPATEYWRGAVTLEEAMRQIEEGLDAISEE